VRTLLGMTDKGVRVDARGPHNYTALHDGERRAKGKCVGSARTICRVGQNRPYVGSTINIHGVYTFFWQGNYQVYGHIRRIYTGISG
jgi:hypothetical protein